MYVYRVRYNFLFISLPFFTRQQNDKATYSSVVEPILELTLVSNFYPVRLLILFGVSLTVIKKNCRNLNTSKITRLNVKYPWRCCRCCLKTILLFGPRTFIWALDASFCLFALFSSVRFLCICLASHVLSEVESMRIKVSNPVLAIAMWNQSCCCVI